MSPEAKAAGSSDGATTVDQLRSFPLFDGLGIDQLRQLHDNANVVRFGPGEVLFQEARPALYWWVLLGGSLDLVRHVGNEDTVLGTMSTPGQWAGGFQAWDPHGVYMATGRGSAVGHVLRLPAERLGELANSWFPFGVHLIRGLTQTVRGIETMARQRESLVALGTLAAGLAHEINNPASAATRAVDAMDETSKSLTSSLAGLVGGPISAQQFAALADLRRQPPTEPAPAEPLAIARREDEITDWLTEHGVEQDWLIAPPLAAAGLDIAWCDRVAELLDGDALEPGLEWVAHSLSMDTLLSEVKESTRRISDLVAVVKSYAQMDRGSVQHTDIVEGLDSTLAVLAHRMGSGVRIVRDYRAAESRIEANAGELNQVWTNLIDNAIDAMSGSGTLRVSVSSERAGLLVEIADSGHGMTHQVQAHAFDPFFTTKEVGKGTGLGLDICRRIIVERHAGEISIDTTEPGETVLRVWLPGVLKAAS